MFLKMETTIGEEQHGTTTVKKQLETAADHLREQPRQGNGNHGCGEH